MTPHDGALGGSDVWNKFLYWGGIMTGGKFLRLRSFALCGASNVIARGFPHVSLRSPYFILAINNGTFSALACRAKKARLHDRSAIFGSAGQGWPP
jgi:hypothetical protein